MDIQEQFIHNKIKDIIENKNIVSNYFLTWLFFKNNLSNFSFNINRFNSEISIIQDNKIIHVYNILNSNDKFLNVLTKSFNINESTEIFYLNIPFYGNLNIMKVSKINYPENVTIYIKTLSNNKDKMSLISGLYFILSNIDDIDTLSQKEKEILNDIFYIQTKQNILFDRNYKESIKILNNYIKIDEIISI